MLHALTCFGGARPIRTWIHNNRLEIGWAVCGLITWFAVTHVYWYMAGCWLLVVWLYRFSYNTWTQHTTPPNEKTDCPICMESIHSDSFAWCTQCRYTFHKECHGQWDDVNTNCPMCRKECGVVTKDVLSVIHDAVFFSSFSQSVKPITIATVLLSILPVLYVLLLPCLFIVAILCKKNT